MTQNLKSMQALEMGAVASEGSVRRTRAARSRIYFSLFAAIADSAAIIVSALVIGWIKQGAK